MSDHVFSELPQLLNPGDLLVVNDTRVRAARLMGMRTSGGKVELLVLEPDTDGTWIAMAKPAKKLTPGSKLEIGGSPVEVVANDGGGLVRVLFDAEDPERFFTDEGTMPLPPYFRGRLEDPMRYQTVFAASPGSAAAPTAGLHFTPRVIDDLSKRGIRVASVDLHVSLDTFRPMTTEVVEDHEMHSEWCSIPPSTARAISKTRNDGGRVVAVGTTVVRTLESRATQNGEVAPGAHRTKLFLRPGSTVKVVDLLITNFHMPRSTLLLLLAAFMGEGWRDTYETALQRGYRFLSFGDAMLAERAS